MPVCVCATTTATMKTMAPCVCNVLSGPGTIFSAVCTFCTMLLRAHEENLSAAEKKAQQEKMQVCTVRACACVHDDHSIRPFYACAQCMILVSSPHQV